ncbi:MAG: ABC transporter ATP-binding protein [Chloroflexales bacterium]|nr:ABC transporter ATP-binding protein [Chloroflexales bacterium]
MLELTNLGFAYTAPNWLFRHVDLHLTAGEIVAILGPNGRGKSTLLRCAAGLLSPQEGSVQQATSIGYVPQSNQVAFAYSAFEMVLMGRARHIGLFAAPRQRDRDRAQQALERVGLAHLAVRPFFHLSGGEQQLVLIARALASESQLLILDEPAAALDLQNQERVLRLLRALARQGLGILLTTHHPQHAQFLADRVLLLYGPDDCRLGPADALLTEANLAELYGVRLRAVTFEEDGRTRQTLAPVYADD